MMRKRSGLPLLPRRSDDGFDLATGSCGVNAKAWVFGMGLDWLSINRRVVPAISDPGMHPNRGVWGFPLFFSFRGLSIIADDLTLVQATLAMAYWDWVGSFFHPVYIFSLSYSKARLAMASGYRGGHRSIL